MRLLQGNCMEGKPGRNCPALSFSRNKIQLKHEKESIIFNINSVTYGQSMV